jgi:hypothetical protein
MFINQVVVSLLILPIIFIDGQKVNSAATQTFCYETTEAPDTLQLWSQAGLDMNVDWVIRCRDIVAYKILWSNAGDWSDWFVTGVNDLLPASGGAQKRMWSLFATHYHIVINCRSNMFKLNVTTSC